jgi:hypothetical protein
MLTGSQMKFEYPSGRKDKKKGRSVETDPRF